MRKRIIETEVRPLWEGWWDRAESIAGFAAKAPVEGAWLGFPERKDAAMDEIIEEITELGGWPADVNVLFRAGQRGAKRAAYEARKHVVYGGFFWVGVPGPNDYLAENVTDRIAVWQIAWGLREIDWEALWALSEVMKWGGSQAEAAALVGLPLAVYQQRLLVARRRAYRLWICPDETPRGRYRPLRRTGTGKAAQYLKNKRKHERKQQAA